MKRLLKSYLVFAPYLYRIFMFLLLPAAVIVLFLFGEMVAVHSAITSAGAVVVTGTLLVLEIMSDNWLFGGIQAKGAVRLDCLKTSGRGMGTMRNALVMDVVRRLFTTAAVLGICALASWLKYGTFFLWNGHMDGVMAFLYGVLTIHILSILGIFVSRFWDLLWINMLLGYAGFFVGAIAWWGFFTIWFDWIIYLNLILILVDILVSVLAVRTAMGKVKEGYYDK